MEWYYTQNDTQSGPITEDQLAELVRTGRVLPSELAWREGMDDWQAIKQISRFKSALPPPPSRPVSPPHNQNPSGAGSATTEANPYKSPQSTPYQQPRNRPVKVDNGLVPAILATILCCPIPGIIAIVYAAQVNGHAMRGDARRAQDAASTARTWTWVAFGLGLAAVLIQVLIAVGSSGY